MREIIKQMALLEDHHIHPEKRCPNCVSKHGKTIEGFAEEAVTLCKPNQGEVAKDAAKVACTIRVLHHAWNEKPKDEDVNVAIARNLRAMRKNLQTKYAFLPKDALPTKESNAVDAFLKSAKAKPKAFRKKI